MENITKAIVNVVKINELNIGDKILYKNFCAEIIGINEKMVFVKPQKCFMNTYKIENTEIFYKVLDCEITKYNNDIFNKYPTTKEVYDPLIEFAKHNNIFDAQEFIIELIDYMVEKFQLSTEDAKIKAYTNLKMYVGFFNRETNNQVIHFYGNDFKNILK